jgi:hypothetical protein
MNAWKAAAISIAVGVDVAGYQPTGCDWLWVATPEWEEGAR